MTVDEARVKALREQQARSEQYADMVMDRVETLRDALNGVADVVVLVRASYSGWIAVRTSAEPSLTNEIVSAAAVELKLADALTGPVIDA